MRLRRVPGIKSPGKKTEKKKKKAENQDVAACLWAMISISARPLREGRCYSSILKKTKLRYAKAIIPATFRINDSRLPQPMGLDRICGWWLCWNSWQPTCLAFIPSAKCTKCSLMLCIFAPIKNYSRWIWRFFSQTRFRKKVRCDYLGLTRMYL